MTSRRTRKTIIYKCDHPRCKARHIAPYVVYLLAWTHAKAAGWIGAKSKNGKWWHFCSWVHRPNSDAALERLAADPTRDPSLARQPSRP